MKFGTKTIHAGQKAEATTGAMTPIYQTSTYIQATPGDRKGMNIQEQEIQQEVL